DPGARCQGSGRPGLLARPRRWLGGAPPGRLRSPREVVVTGSAPAPGVGSLFAGGGELGLEMAARDWSQTPLGPPASWLSALRNAVRIVLTSRFSMWMAWGEELTFFYNDAYWRDTL